MDKSKINYNYWLGDPADQDHHHQVRSPGARRPRGHVLRRGRDAGTARGIFLLR